MYKILFHVNKEIILSLVVFNCWCFSSTSFPQNTTSTSEKNKLVFEPTFHSIQLDATIFIFLYEVGGQFDFDLFTNNKRICLGTRMSIEHYALGDVGGEKLGSPFTNYNIYARFSDRLGFLSINVLGGVTYYTTDDPIYLPDKYMPRVGFEIKFTDNILGLVLKGSTSFVDKSGYVGVGVSLGYNHN